MIVTRSWLEEWVDLSGITTDDICKKLNAIGLEVDALTRYRMPENIVVGYVKSCEKHPDADKLSVCQIDLGDQTRQIVCGAKNIREGLYVPVATIGAVMPNGMKIKHAKLRGVESDGMVCSATELGLPELNAGILELDDSIGALEAGKPLKEYTLLNDDVIEIELTANRGDCLSIHGVARELSVAFDRPMKGFEKIEEPQGEGIGRILQFKPQDNPPVSLLYRAFEIESLPLPLLIRLRVAWAELEAKTTMDHYFAYAIHATGVVLRRYDFAKIAKGDRARIFLDRYKESLGAVKSEDRLISIVGVWQDPELIAAEDADKVLIEASYTRPELIAPAVKQEGLKTDELYYRTSRGSEPDLEFGMAVLMKEMTRYADVKWFSGTSEYAYGWEPVTFDIDVQEIEALVGQPVDLSQAVNILGRLGFTIHKTEGERVVLEVPPFRHDIFNKQDVIEEIVRIIGIDNITAQPLCFTEANRMTHDLAGYRFIRDLRLRAVANGFFETVHYIFCDSNLVKRLGFTPLQESKALLNPITNEMDSLRPALMVTMLETLKRNVAFSKRRIPLFEVGRVFNAERHEYFHMLLVYAGEKEPASLQNAGKPEPIDLPTFVDLLAGVIGTFELRQCDAKNGLMHPYLSAHIVVDGEAVGILSKLHPEVADAFDLPDTFYAELEMEKLHARHVEAEGISAYTPVQRDLSLLVPESLSYTVIREALEGSLPQTVSQFFPIDRYQDDTMGDRVSLTMRFIISSKEKTLEENEINAIMESVLKRLETACGATIR